VLGAAGELLLARAVGPDAPDVAGGEALLLVVLAARVEDDAAAVGHPGGHGARAGADDAPGRPLVRRRGGPCPPGERQRRGEHERAEIVGLVSVLCLRSLARGGRSALLDGARARRPALLAGLVAFAEERARKRGCRRLAAWVEAGDAELHAALLARGYHAGELLVTELAGAS